MKVNFSKLWLVIWSSIIMIVKLLFIFLPTEENLRAEIEMKPYINDFVANLSMKIYLKEEAGLFTKVSFCCSALESNG